MVPSWAGVADPWRAATDTLGWLVPRRFPALAALVLVVLALLAASCGSGDGDEATISTEQVAQAPADAPNLVVIMTDDQTLESMRVMTRTNELLAAQGTTFEQAIASFPLCCPSRATFLTGQYAHNHGVVGNLPPLGGYSELDNLNTLPVWLQRAGYATSHVGHYLYGYGGGDSRDVPAGWDDWFATVDPSTFRYFDYTVNDNGEIVGFDDREEHYQSDVFADRAVEEVDRLADGDKPFFLDLWFLAPHVERPEHNAGAFTQVAARPAPRHEGQMAGETWPRTPSFNEEDVSDKPGYISARGPLNPITQIEILNHYQAALESLLAVDEAVDRLVSALEDAGVLDDTVIAFTSDNGLLQGEHRIRDAKILPYEEAIQVPLVIRGPGFPAGEVVPGPVANVDLPATLLDAAGVEPGLDQDGISLLPVAADPAIADERVVFIENGPQEGSTFRHFEGVRVDGFTYVEYETGVVELYDLTADPYELENVAGDPAYADREAQLAELLEAMRDCAAQECRDPTFAS